MKLPIAAKKLPAPEKDDGEFNDWKSYDVTRIEVRPGIKGRFEARVYMADGTMRKLVIAHKLEFLNDLEGEERRRERRYSLD